MARNIRFKCENRYGAEACEIGKQTYPGNLVEITEVELAGRSVLPCPKCGEPLKALDPVGQTGSSIPWLPLGAGIGGVALLAGAVWFFFLGETKELSGKDAWEPLDAYYRSS